MVKRTVFLHDDDDVANLVDSLAVARVIAGRTATRTDQNRCREY
jgi:hypothetical protein